MAELRQPVAIGCLGARGAEDQQRDGHEGLESRRRHMPCPRPGGWFQLDLDMGHGTTVAVVSVSNGAVGCCAFNLERRALLTRENSWPDVGMCPQLSSPENVSRAAPPAPGINLWLLLACARRHWLPEELLLETVGCPAA